MTLDPIIAPQANPPRLKRAASELQPYGSAVLALVLALLAMPSCTSPIAGTEVVETDAGASRADGGLGGTEDLGAHPEQDVIAADALDRGIEPLGPLQAACSCAPVVVWRYVPGEAGGACDIAASFSPCYEALTKCGVLDDAGEYAPLPCAATVACDSTVRLHDAAGRSSTSGWTGYTSAQTWAFGQAIAADVAVLVRCLRKDGEDCHAPATVLVTSIAANAAKKSSPSEIAPPPRFPGQQLGAHQSWALGPAVQTEALPLPAALVALDPVPSSELLVWPAGSSATLLTVSRGVSKRHLYVLWIDGADVAADEVISVVVAGRTVGEQMWRQVYDGPASGLLLLGVLAVGQCRHQPGFMACETESASGLPSWRPVGAAVRAPCVQHER